MTRTTSTLREYDGVAVETLRARAGASRLTAVDVCGSTMDLAHDQAAAGAPHGTVVVAVQQESGRGRTGKSWTSPQGAGVWASVVVRPESGGQGGVLSLRVGLELASRLDHLAASSIQLKWPNDLFVNGRKLAGILTEARWRGDALEWIVVGIGVNVRAAPPEMHAASLADTATCADVLVALVNSVLVAAAAPPSLTDGECRRYAARDLALGREITSPMAGTVLGITPEGSLRVATAQGESVAVAGSLTFTTH